VIKLLGIAGSIRRDSYNRALLRAVGAALPADATLTPYDQLAALPTFDPDLTIDPPAVVDFKHAIAGADGLVIATPEYNYSLPGVLKNAIDWASRPPSTSPLRGKPVGIVSAAAGMSGGMRAQYHLRQILVFTDSPAMLQPEVFVARPQDRFVDGVLTDAATIEHLRRFGTALVTWVTRFVATTA
jgi:chromate reductase, NAD(P)H dehydrogenase (quinone)